MTETVKPWTTVAERLREIKRLDSVQPRKHFVILGAGIAGLVAAYELERLGHTCEILEASARAGGRIFTHRFASKQYGELGAMRIPAAHDYTRHYISELGLTLRPFVNSATQGFYDVRDMVLRQGGALSGLVRAYSLTPEEQGVVLERGIGFILGSIVSREVEKLSAEEKADLFDGKITTDNLRRLDATSVRAALKREWSTGAVSLTAATTTLESLWARPLAKYVLDALTENALGLEEIVGGMDLLPSGLRGKLSGKVTYRSEVFAVSVLSDARIQLVVGEGDGSASERICDYVLCTLPFGVLRRLQLAGMSARKMRSIRNLSYVSATKVLLHCSSRFWETRYGIVGGRSVSDRISRQTYYPSDNVPPLAAELLTLRASLKDIQPYMWGLHTGPEILPKVEGEAFAGGGFESADVSEGPGVLLGSYSWGLDAQRIGALARDERAQVVGRSISRFHPEIFDYVDGHASMFWDQHRWSMGGYADTLPGDTADYYHDGLKAEGNLFFAGEHLSPFHGWIQGGVYSSLRAVEEMIAR
jgi:monoamine oxidase